MVRCRTGSLLLEELIEFGGVLGAGLVALESFVHGVHLARRRNDEGGGDALDAELFGEFYDPELEKIQYSPF